MNKKNYISELLISWPLALFSLSAAFYIILRPTPRNGLEFLFILPFSVFICTLFFSKIITYQKNGIGLKIFYIIILIRYIMSPVLISATDGYYSPLMKFASADGYRTAIFISIIELFATCSTIAICWEKVNTKIQKKINNSPTYNYTLTIGGFIVLVLLVFIILSRGMEGVTSSFGFLLLYEKYSADFVDSYAIIAIQVLKSFLCICIISWSSKNYQRNNKLIWCIIPCAAAFFNITTFFGYNRSLILETAIATVFTLYAAFPKLKKFITISLIPVTIILLYSIITLKQFGVSANSVGVSELTNLNGLSTTIETYVNGMWPMATSFDAAEGLKNHISFLTIIKDITDNIFLFKVPGFMWINDIFTDVPSTVLLYQIHTYPAQGAMLPIAGQMWFYGSYILGPLLTLLSNVFVVYLLVVFEVKSKLKKEFQSIFLHYWLSSLFGFMMCYCLITLIWCFSKFAFFLILLFWVNNKNVLNRNNADAIANEYLTNNIRRND